MAFLETARPAPAVTGSGSRKIVGAGERDRQSCKPTPSKTQSAIRAELLGSNTCSARGFTSCGVSPVLDLCRLLVDAGFDPGRPLYAYRGKTLCLRIRSIGEAARLRVATRGCGFVRLPERTTAPPMRLQDLAGPETPETAGNAIQAESP